MKTAVQELIEKIKVRIPFFQYSVYQDDFDLAIHKEKAQLVDAFYGKENITFDEYYERTFSSKFCHIHDVALNEDGLCNTCLEQHNA